MSEFNWQPAYGSQRSRAPRARVASFGDGYQQRVADGINTQPATWRLTFNVQKSVADAIESFLEGKDGVQSFTWTPSGMSEVTVKCSEWSRAITAPNTATVYATFEQVFE